jgi:hypothetical protein
VNYAVRLQAAVLLVAAWIGAALITIAVVAPAAFAVLPSRTMAGTMVGGVLPALFVAGIVTGILAAGIAMRAPAGGPTDPPLPGARRWAAASALVAAMACAIAQFGITPRLDRLRAEIGGPVDALPVDDARRVAFGLFHGYNVAGLGVAMVGAVVCLGFLLFAAPSRN